MAIAAQRLKDRFGLSWQVVPSALPEKLMDPDAETSQRLTKAFLQMKKFDLDALRRAYEGAA
jgi:predicted 3-demethylubiquinone-9 3-methyltransferase (glyoxalase superfamily)